MAPKLKLVYFNIRGRGELIRLILHAGGVEFMDQRIEFTDWPAHKPNAPQGVLPYIDADGNKYGEAPALVRLVAKKCNLLGKDEAEQLQVDILLCQIHSLRDDMARYKMDPILRKDQRKYLQQKVIRERIPQFLQRMESSLSTSKTGFLLGNGMTAADLALFDTVDAAMIETPTLLVSYPKVAEHREKVKSQTKLSKYLSSRPDTKM